jgi:DnaJ-class molecular chaperone
MHQKNLKATAQVYYHQERKQCPHCLGEGVQQTGYPCAKCQGSGTLVGHATA